MTRSDSHDLAVMLEPVLHHACDGRLGAIEWFHAAWQRGGAATGFATFRIDNQQPPREALVKLPLSPREYQWTTRLGCVPLNEFDAPASLTLPVPRVLAHGLELGGYDLAWVVVERLQGEHMPRQMTTTMVEELLGRVFEFHQRTSAIEPVDTTHKPHTPDWPTLLEKSRQQCREHAITDFSRWADAVRKVQRALPALHNRWDARALDTWCHGDVHPGNVLRRPAQDPSTPGMCVLIDMGLVHPGHWIEDALYLERQYWGHETWLGNAKPLSILARLRREAGLPTHGDYTELANIRRVLMAACVPAVIDREGVNAKYLERALKIIETTLPQIPH